MTTPCCGACLHWQRERDNLGLCLVEVRLPCWITRTMIDNSAQRTTLAYDGATCQTFSERKLKPVLKEG